MAVTCTGEGRVLRAAISGEVDLEAEWDNFQQSLIDAGLNDVIAVYEAGGIR